VGAYVYSTLGELYKVHPKQKHHVREKIGIVMESKGANKWLVNSEDNTTLTLKSNQIQVTQQKKPSCIQEPVQEDDSHLNSLSFFFTPLKNKASEEATMLDSDDSVEYSDKGSALIRPTRNSIIVLSTPSANTNIVSRKSTTVTNYSTTSTSTTAMATTSGTSTATVLNFKFEEDDDSSYIKEEIMYYNDEFVANNLKQAEDWLTYDRDDDSDEIAGGEVVNEEYEDDINEYEYQFLISSRMLAALQCMTTDVVEGTGRKKKTMTWMIIPYHEAPTWTHARSKATLGIRSWSVLDDLNDSDLPLAGDLFLYLTFRGGRWQRWLRVMNMKVKDLNDSQEF
jgi:hypothetical protein